MLNNRFLQIVLIVAFTAVIISGATAQMATGSSPSSNVSNNISEGVDLSQDVNVVLVHGAWADGSSWSRVIPLLQERGFRVTAVQLSGMSLAEDANITSRALATQNGSTILVGHSYGGAVITVAGADAPNVSGLVYIAAYAPDENEVLGALNARFPPPVGQSKFVPDAGGFLYIDQAAYPEVFAPDVDPAEARVLAAVQMPISASIFNDTASKAAWASKPSWFLVSEDDLIVSPNLQRFEAERMGANVTSIPSSHVSLISHLEEVAQLIMDAANETANVTAGATVTG